MRVFYSLGAYAAANGGMSPQQDGARQMSVAPSPSARLFGAHACAILFAAFFIAVAAAPASAQDTPSETQIRDALKSSKPAGQGLTRSLTRSLNAPKEPDHSGLVRSLATRNTRAITIEERKQIAEIAKTSPQIDLTINFDYDSAQVKPQSIGALVQLGRALSSDDLKNGIFLINGHTDGAGGADYNQDLSQRRAEAVKKILVEQFGIKPTALVAVGFGFSQLKNASDPLAAENRRVQIVNTEVK